MGFLLRSSLLLAALLLLAACGGSPVLAISPTTYDFGSIAADVPVSTTLQVRNAGRSELTIHSVRTSCGCTTAQLNKSTLAPGDVTELVIAFDPQAHPGLYGPLLRVVFLQSNDPAQPEVEVPLHVDIIQPHQER